MKTYLDFFMRKTPGCPNSDQKPRFCPEKNPCDDHFLKPPVLPIRVLLQDFFLTYVEGYGPPPKHSQNKTIWKMNVIKVFPQKRLSNLKIIYLGEVFQIFQFEFWTPIFFLDFRIKKSTFKKFKKIFWLKKQKKEKKKFFRVGNRFLQERVFFQFFEGSFLRIFRRFSTSDSDLAKTSEEFKNLSPLAKNRRK